MQIELDESLQTASIINSFSPKIKTFNKITGLVEEKHLIFQASVVKQKLNKAG